MYLVVSYRRNTHSIGIIVATNKSKDIAFLKDTQTKNSFKVVGRIYYAPRHTGSNNSHICGLIM